MKTQDLRKKTEKELQDMVGTLKEKGQDLRFQLAAGKIKNTREIRSTKKSIARAQTILQEKRTKPSVAKEAVSRKESQDALTHN